MTETKVVSKTIQYGKQHWRIIEFHHFTTGTKETKLSLYDERDTHRYLRDDFITLAEFQRLCEVINIETGDQPALEPTKVRDKL